MPRNQHEIAARDEDDRTNEVNHVLLGGILIASPARSRETPANRSSSGQQAVQLLTVGAAMGGGGEPAKVDVIEVVSGVVRSGDDDVAVQSGAENDGDDDEATADAVERLLTATAATQCRPECAASRNELCQRVDAEMRCVCRPGFARMFPDRPCKRKFSRLVLA